MSPVYDHDKPKEHYVQFQPKTEEQVRRLLPDGDYDFEIVQALDKNSSNGNPMIELNLRIFVGGGEKFVKDWVMEKVDYKLRHFAFAVGMGPAYEAGGLDAELLVGRAGKVKIGTEPAKGDFPPKNKVVDYVVPADQKEASSAAKKPAGVTPSPTPSTDEPPF